MGLVFPKTEEEKLEKNESKDKPPPNNLPKNALKDKPPPNGKKERFKRRVLGPVPDLEEHVHPSWWRNIFNSLYLKTDGDVVEDQKITSEETDLFSTILDLSEEDKILDLCCGQGRHALELARRGFKSVEGLDRSHYLIQRAKNQAKKEGLDVRFKDGDARKLPYPPAPEAYEPRNLTLGVVQ
ncbi:MAG: methyltransferase domain-containing protein [Candidatus Aminicenantes bacterium]|nr:methyltransferase domain-containing protein [Candidatus Aminicenantes bacterium]